MNPHEEHRKAGERKLSARVFTVSTSRYMAMKEGAKFTDESGDVAEEELKGAGHAVASRGLISDDAQMLREVVREFLSGKDDVLLFTGGTGISSRDITIETVRPFFEKELAGFGEQFRRASFDEVGAAAMMTRATLGVAKGKLILCLPGSPSAVRTALREVTGELPHAVHIAHS